MITLKSKDMINERVDWGNDLLDFLGSDQDPIKFKGKETTIRDLSMRELRYESIHDIEIEFVGGEEIGWIKGTVADMILDRLKQYEIYDTVGVAWEIL